MRVAFVLMLAVVGCGGGDDSGLEDTEDTVDTNEPQGCETTEIAWDGPDAPQVGDEWTVFMRCDGGVLTGAAVIRFDPPDFADLDENVVTWTTAGTTEMMVQIGVYREYMDVTVTDAQ